MAETMEDSFQARVDKIFGSLTPSSSAKNEPPFSPQSTPWSVIDEAVERKEWRRESSNTNRDEIPCASSFDELRKARKDRRRNRKKKQLDDDDDEEEEEEEEGNLDDRSDEWDIRSSIGLDRTLDNEEEEDEFDKVAEGRENAGDRLYMKDVNDKGSHLNFYTVVGKDPRANLLAAEIRFREDEDEAGKQNSYDDSDVVGNEEVGKTVSVDDGVRLRPILKRKHGNSDSKSRTRVRFDPGCKISREEYEPENVQGILEGGSMSGQDASGVPGYLRNPSQYTRYSFDSSSEVDEKSNAQDFMEFLKLAKNSKPTETGAELQEDASADLPKSVAFIPKKKAGACEAGHGSSKVKQEEENVGFPVGIAAEEEEDADDEMKDRAECNTLEGSSSFQKSGRRYRAKSGQHDFDP